MLPPTEATSTTTTIGEPEGRKYGKSTTKALPATGEIAAFQATFFDSMLNGSKPKNKAQ